MDQGRAIRILEKREEELRRLQHVQFLHNELVSVKTKQNKNHVTYVES